MPTNANQNPRNNVPAAWYDLSCRIGSTKAVANYIMEAIPVIKGNQAQWDAANDACNLASAVVYLLEMCEQDILRLERQLLDAV